MLLTAERTNAATGRISLRPRECPMRIQIVAEEVKAVVLVAFLALIGLTLWATGHLIVR